MPAKRDSMASISGVSVASIAPKDDHRALGLRMAAMQGAVAAVEQPFDHRVAITGKPGTKCTSPQLKPGILL
jgi:hypothetical protein